MSGLLNIKVAQVQLSKSGLNLLTFSDIDLSPQHLSDRLLHLMQRVYLIPRDFL
jgi:hypothetical protein